MSCPLKSIAFWPYESDIPDGWSSVSAMAFDGRFLQGDDPDTFRSAVDGGASSHNHTISDHTHIGDPHTHLVKTSGNPFPDPALFDTTGGGSKASTQDNHTHQGNAPTSTFTYSSSTASSTSVSVQPPYVKAVIIEPIDASQDVPNDALVLTDAETPPMGFDAADGLGGRPDLDGLFILGCLDGVGNGGGDTGGSETHRHAIVHGTLHLSSTPDHGSFFSGSGQSSPFDVLVGGGGGEWVLLIGHHSIGAMSHGAEPVRAAPGAQLWTDFVNHEPAHVELMAMINTSGQPKTPVGVIMGYTGVSTDLPSNWKACDGTNGTPDCRGRQVKMVTSAPGGSGGDNTHDHDWFHTHAHLNTHNHSVSASYNASSNKAFSGSSSARERTDHTHTWTSSSTRPTLQGTTVTTSEDDARAPFRTMIWIKQIANPDRAATVPPEPAVVQAIQLIRPVILMPIVVVPESQAFPVDEFATFSPFTATERLHVFNIPAPLTPVTPITVTLTAKADLHDPINVLLFLNGVNLADVIGPFFEGISEFDGCPITPYVDVKSIPATTWNEIVEAGNVAITMIMAGGAGSVTCPNSFITIRVEYTSVDQPPDPPFVGWRTPDRIQLGDGRMGHLWGELELDDVVGGLVVRIDDRRLDKVTLCGLAVERIDGAMAIVARGTYEVRGTVLRFSSSGTCGQF